MSIRLGIIGAGTIGQVHAAAAQAAGMSVARVIEVQQERGRALAAQFAGAIHSSNVSDLLNDSTINAVVIAVPNRWHKELALAALEAGKDVLLEKPMGMNRTECAEINRVADAQGRILQIGMANRFSAVGQAAKPIVSGGELGHIYHAKALLYRRRGVPGLGGWFTTKAISGGGVLIDNGVHLIDLALWLMGFPQVTRVSGKVYGFFGKRMKDYIYETMWAGPPNPEGVCDVEDSAHALIHFAGGATLDVQVAWAINIPAKLESSLMGFFGDRGGLTFELFGDHLDLATEHNRRNVDTRVNVPETDQFAQQMLSFAKSIQTREFPVATGQQGELVQSILDAIYESSASDREVVFRA